MKGKILQTVVETPEFTKQASLIVDEGIVKEFIDFVAHEPKKGEVIQGTSGIRKVRWQTTKSSGKSGGMRVIYYYHSQEIPIFLLTAYAKNKKANISSRDKVLLKKLIKRIVELYEENDYV